MLKTSCINPQILKTLSALGHGDKILIADGNYPLDSKTNTDNMVYLGVSAGIPTVTQVLEALQGMINIEAAEVMATGDGSVPAIMGEFSAMLGNIEIKEHGRYEFYDACCQPSVKLAISTGEQRVFANLLITVGVA